MNWDFVFSVLQKFGYGEKFIRMCKVAYTNIESKIKINGLLSNPFTLIQGVRQGCPLSLVVVVVVVCVCVCVCARARACVCVCVIIFFHCEGFFRLQNVQNILEGTDQRSCVVNIS